MGRSASADAVSRQISRDVASRSIRNPAQPGASSASERSSSSAKTGLAAAGLRAQARFDRRACHRRCDGAAAHGKHEMVMGRRRGEIARLAERCLADPAAVEHRRSRRFECGTRPRPARPRRRHVPRCGPAAPPTPARRATRTVPPTARAPRPCSRRPMLDPLRGGVSRAGQEPLGHQSPEPQADGTACACNEVTTRWPRASKVSRCARGKVTASPNSCMNTT